jgi:hypothetical protein
MVGGGATGEPGWAISAYRVLACHRTSGRMVIDGRQFDALARLVSAGPSQRATLKGLLGWTVNGAAVAVGSFGHNDLWR